MADRRMALADLVTGALLFVLSVAVIYGAWTMDRLEIRQIHPSSVPGLTPGLLGLALALVSLLLILKAARSFGPVRGGAETGAEPAESDSDPRSAYRLVLAAVLCLIYSLGLVGRIPFWLATALFVTAFIALFEWERGGTRARRLTRLVWAVSLGVATGIIVSFVFRDLFLVRLP